MRLQDLCSSSTDSDLELIIDLSNICRNKDLDSTSDNARWDRIIRVIEVWNATFPSFEKPKVRMVADNNLRFKFLSEDLALMKEALRSGFVIEAEKADPVLLDLAENFNCLILSNDNYVGYQGERPWICSTERKRFIQVNMSGTKIELKAISHSERTGFSKSRAEEKDLLKNLHIDPVGDANSDLLKSLFRCDNPLCIRRAVLPDGAISTPERGVAGAAICPGCHETLTRVGAASQTMIFKLTSTESKKDLRIPLEAGREIILGRSSTDISLTEILDDVGLARISRSHAKVGFNGHHLYIEDLGSSNGSTIAFWDSEMKHFSSEQKLESGLRIILKPRDMVVLAGVLEIQRSGRRFPFDLAQLTAIPNNIRESPKTNIFRGE